MTDVPMAGTSELDLGRCISEGSNSECSGFVDPGRRRSPSKYEIIHHSPQEVNVL